MHRMGLTPLASVNLLSGTYAKDGSSNAFKNILTKRFVLANQTRGLKTLLQAVRKNDRPQERS